jgi:hypothetical protein
LVDETDQPYAFLNDNPLNFTDPIGNLACGVGKASSTCDKVIPKTISVTVDFSQTANGDLGSASKGQVPTTAEVIVVFEDGYGQTDYSTYVYHYTTLQNAEGILEDGEIAINPQTGVAWVSPTLFTNANDAQNNLSLPTTPGGYFKIRLEDVSNMTAFKSADPVDIWEGGGLEGSTTDPIPIDPLGDGFIPFDPIADI